MISLDSAIDDFLMNVETSPFSLLVRRLSGPSSFSAGLWKTMCWSLTSFNMWQSCSCSQFSGMAKISNLRSCSHVYAIMVLNPLTLNLSEILAARERWNWPLWKVIAQYHDWELVQSGAQCHQWGFLDLDARFWFSSFMLDWVHSITCLWILLISEKITGSWRVLGYDNRCKVAEREYWVLSRSVMCAEKRPDHVENPEVLEHEGMHWAGHYQ